MDTIEKFVRIAKEAGLPKDQLVNFLKYKYIPLKWQLKFHSEARKADTNRIRKIGVGGARGPGKSHGVFAQICLDDCQRIPRLKGLFLRQTGKSARESFEDLIESVLRRRINYKYNIGNGMLTFANGSRVLLGGFENERDIDKYIGIQYDVMAIEELNQLTEDKVVKLEGSLRTDKPEWKPRLYASFNPGGIGHQFIKETYVIPHREDREERTKFIPSTYKDNPYLNKEYVEYLGELKGTLGRAWREGDWDIFEGQYFNEWRNEKHTCSPFFIPDTWKRYRGYDHGRKAPACCKWYAIDYDGRVWVYRELYVTGWDADKIAQEVVRLTGNERIEYTVADASIFSQIGHGETIAEILARNGMVCIPSSKDRVAGWTIMHQYLYHTEIENPKMIYFNTCYDSIRTTPSLIHDDHRPEDLNTNGEDHCADTDRYFLQTLRDKKTKEPMTEIEKKILSFKQHQEPSFLEMYE